MAKNKGGLGGLLRGVNNLTRSVNTVNQTTNAVKRTAENSKKTINSNKKQKDQEDAWLCECGVSCTANFCSSCGKPAPAELQCSNCEQKIEDTSQKFCANCGTKLEE